MGTVFLVDGHTSVLANSEINDTIPLEAGETQTLNGSFVVNVPFGVPVNGTPTDLTTLLADKFTGLLAYYPGYTYIDYDEGIDATNWDSSSSQGVGLGDRGNVYVLNGGVLLSSAVTLTGVAPSAAIITWEVFELSMENDINGVVLRKYTEGDPSDLTVQASFNNGTDYTSGITDGVQFDIPAFRQGAQFILRLTNSSGRRLWVGSWAVIY
jgi:hypothetical protein